MTSQKPPTLQECLDAPAYSAVTQSWCAIESQDTAKLYITPPPKDRKKPKDPRFACLGYIQKLKAIPSTAKNILVWLVMERQWRTDRLIIVGKGECADHFGLSRRQVIRLFQILEESGCLRIVKRGGSTRGSKREANTYALGSLFDNLPPEESKRRPVSGMSLVPQVPLVPKMSDDQCQECHPLPIVSPYKNPHTDNKSNNKSEREEPSAPDSLSLTKENWLNRGKKKYPDWDEKDLHGCFYDAEGKGKGVNGTWPSYQDKCYVRRFNTMPTPRPSFTPRPERESPRPEPTDYDHLPTLTSMIYYTTKIGESLVGIQSSSKPEFFKIAQQDAIAELMMTHYFDKHKGRWVSLNTAPEPTHSL